MPRKRFNTAERAMIEDLGGQPVEWQNVAIWHRGILTSGIRRDEFGWESVVVDNQVRTPRLSPGPIGVGPGHLRAPQS